MTRKEQTYASPALEPVSIPDSSHDPAAVLVVIPCLNEERHLDRLLTQLRADPGAGRAHIVVADGGSGDKSADIVRAHARDDARVSLFHNEKVRQASGFNAALRRFLTDEVEYVIRIDAHASYPHNYCARLVATQRQCAGDSVVVAMVADADFGGWFQRAAACAQNSLLGTGGSAHRHRGQGKWVEHGHHALMTTTILRVTGGYDESFSHNEDAELDARIARLGGRIYLAGDIVARYHPRATARALFRQYFAFGRGRANTICLHRKRPALRQIVPLAVAPATAMAAFAPIWPWAAVPAAAWLGLTLGYGALLGLRQDRTASALSGIPAAIMHLAWSLGFAAGLLSPYRAHRNPHHATVI